MINIWVAVKASAKDNLKARKAWGEDNGLYVGPVTNDEHKIFERGIDTYTVQGLFQSPTLSNTKYYVYSLYFSNIEEVIEAMSVSPEKKDKYFVLHTPWDMDGLPIGCEWVPNPDPEGTEQHLWGITGEPMIQTDTRLLKLMPDIVTGYVDDIPQYAQATVPAQVNLLSGQADRIFLKTDGTIFN